MEVCRAHPGFALAARAFRVVAVHVARRGGRHGGCLCHGERLAPAKPRLRPNQVSMNDRAAPARVLVAPVPRHLDGVGWVRAGSEFGGVWGVNSRTHEVNRDGCAICKAAKHGVVGGWWLLYGTLIPS